MQPNQVVRNAAKSSLCGMEFAAGSPRVVLDCHGRERTFNGLCATVRAEQPEDVAASLSGLQSHLAAGRWAAGYLSYELGYAFERRLLPLLTEHRNLPLLWFGIFDSCETLDALGKSGARGHAGKLSHEWDSARYRAAFDRIHALIDAGDLYQANLSWRARFAFAGDAFAFWRELRARACARHCAFVDDGERQILSLSPELFFEIDAARTIRARPMKGTAARGRTPEEDSASHARLFTSEKERAENLMIVDLLRNDLGRISRTGSVTVEKLYEIETYPTLHQMVSTVAAQLKPDAGPESIVRALFPCGSVTGAPKLRAMEIIRDAESGPRGVYCGAIGHFAPDGSASFNVAIRTLTISGGWGELGIGGAIVHDSRADSEYLEALLKARFYETVRRPLSLIETLRFEPGTGFVRLGRHLARMASSAATLGLPYDSARARETLDGAIAAVQDISRVRLELDEEGALTASAQPFVPGPPAWRYAISPVPVSSSDPLLRHKTSRRELHDCELSRLAAETGCDEVIFVNERDELTEGSRTNIFVEMDGLLFTPASSSGLLDGCLRRELLDERRCAEAILTCADLARADRVFLGNSLRGLIASAPAQSC